MKQFELVVFLVVAAIWTAPASHAATPAPEGQAARISIAGNRWQINGAVTYPGTRAEGLLMNVRMVNAVFEDRAIHRDFDAEANTDRFIARIPDYAAQGVRAFTICLQGGNARYEGALDPLNSAFEPDGTLRQSYLRRVRRVIDSCDRQGMAVILGCFYQKQSKVFRDEAALRAGLVNAVNWIRASGLKTVMLEVANEFPHDGFVHPLIRSPQGMAGLIRLAKQTWPELLVSASGMGDGKLDDAVAEASDFLLIHFNGTPVQAIPARVAALKRFGKPIVCNEDDKPKDSASSAEACVANGASYGLMLNMINQRYPFVFNGPADEPVFYAKLKELTTARPAVQAASEKGEYFPPPESQGGWRKLDKPEDIRSFGGMDPAKLEDLKQWLMDSDKRNFAAVVIRHGHIVLEVERGNSAKTDSRRVASVSKAVCATVLAIASEQSQKGLTPKKMTFDDPAFDFLPWAQPLSDPRKAKITVRQLLNHTSGICPEATGAPTDATWDYIMGHTGDPRTAKLAFDPGTACGYSTHALNHAALVCETITGKPYDQYAIEALFKPLGIEHWWFLYYDGPPKYGRHPSQAMGMPARDLARICYCMLRDGRWNDRQVIPRWFVGQTGGSSHNVKTPEMRWKFNPQTFVLGWERPSLMTGPGDRVGTGIPSDARHKPGSGGQLVAFVPSLDLVVTRQTGGSGEWQFEEYLRRACAAIAAPDK